MTALRKARKRACGEAHEGVAAAWSLGAAGHQVIVVAGSTAALAEVSALGAPEHPLDPVKCAEVAVFMAENTEDA